MREKVKEENLMFSDNVLAIIYALTAYSMLNIGLVLEKKGASELPAIEKTSVAANIRGFLSNPKWLIGFILTNVQILPLFMALGYGQISLVSPMMGFGMVVLVLFSVIYLKEAINRPMLAGIALTIAGIVILNAVNSDEEISYSIAEITVIIKQPASIGFFIFLVTGTAVPALFCIFSGYRASDVLFGVSSGFAAAIGFIFSKIMMSSFDMSDFCRSLVQNLATWQFYFFLILITGFNLGSMVFQQLGFQKGKAVILAPIFTVCTVVIPVFTGVVFFGDWLRFSFLIAAIRAGAIIMLLAGITVLSYFNSLNKTIAPT
jgi:uncharacterized membrane protein